MIADLDLTFPPVPQNADKKIIRPSRAYKLKVFTSILSILLFVVTYLCLFVAAIAIAIALGFLAYKVLVMSSSFFVFIFGLASIGAGLLLVYFVIKFLFKRTKHNSAGLVEVTEAEQPRLFSFIRQLTKEINAPFPKHIYLSADVNAFVFYNSSFWSMFLPVRKNLNIGLGLVNSLNLSEFKVVMAHEFGHFSQRSMKFGSYINNLNKVIYNMLDDNDGYNRLLSEISKAHSIFFLAAKLNVWIIRGMQAILMQVYIIINKNYMGLSRQAEFHADAMAAYVAGSNQGIACLKKIDAAQQCYDNLLTYWGNQLEQKKKSDNFYPQHLQVMRNYAVLKNITTDANGLPIFDSSAGNTRNSKLVLHDQWSSHPTTIEREEHFNKINLHTPTIQESAWVLFTNATELQKNLTDYLYANVEVSTDTRRVGLEEFAEDFGAANRRYKLPDIYKGHYNERYISEFDVDKAISSAVTITHRFDDLLSAENAALPDKIASYASDISTLDIIIDIRKDIKTFDFDGVRYERSKAAELKDQLEAEKAEAVRKMEKLDEAIFIFAYQTVNSTESKNSLKDLYQSYFANVKAINNDFDTYTNVATKFAELKNVTSIDAISTIVGQLYKAERPLRTRMQEAIDNNLEKPMFNNDQLEKIGYYLSNKWVYFTEPTFDDEAINAYCAATDAFVQAVSDSIFANKKRLLQFQAALIHEECS